MSLVEGLHFSALVTRGRAVASGYSTRLFVTHEFTHLDSIALRLQHG